MIANADPADVSALGQHLLHVWYIPALMVVCLCCTAAALIFRPRRRLIAVAALTLSIIGAVFGLNRLNTIALVNQLSSESDPSAEHAYLRLSKSRSLSWAFDCLNGRMETDDYGKFYAAVRIGESLRNEPEKLAAITNNTNYLKTTIRASFFSTNGINRRFYETFIIKPMTISEVISVAATDNEFRTQKSR